MQRPSMKEISNLEVTLSLDLPMGEWLDMPPPTGTPESNEAWQTRERLRRLDEAPQLKEEWLHHPLPTVPFVWND